MAVPEINSGHALDGASIKCCSCSSNEVMKLNREQSRRANFKSDLIKTRSLLFRWSQSVLYYIFNILYTKLYLVILYSQLFHIFSLSKFNWCIHIWVHHWLHRRGQLRQTNTRCERDQVEMSTEKSTELRRVSAGCLWVFVAKRGVCFSSSDRHAVGSFASFAASAACHSLGVSVIVKSAQP